MRGRLIKPKARVLYWAGMLCLLLSGVNIAQFVKLSVWGYLIAGLFSGGVGLFSLIHHWRINHPKIPEWAEDCFKEAGPNEIKIGRLNNE